MDLRHSSTSARYLPTKKSLLFSQSRIAKINQLYEHKKREDRDSVVSNNSTSVISDEQEADNCIPISGLTYGLHNNYHVDEPTETVKQENGINPFRTGSTRKSLTPSPPHSPTVVINGNHWKKTGYSSEKDDVHIDDDDGDEDYEAELRFTPKLKSRNSLITMRIPSGTEKEAEKLDNNENLERLRRAPQHIRKTSRTLSLRKTLGDPLPLPYIKSEHSPENSIISSSGNNSILTPDALNKKRQDMETKWRKLISQDRSIVENRFQELRNNILPTAGSVRANELLPPMSSSTIQGETINSTSLSKLNEEIITNRKKLDHIIDLLNQKNHVPKSMGTDFYPNESIRWTICIIVLIICNIYVYSYL